MNEYGFKSVHCRRRQRSLTDSRKSRGTGYENLVKKLKKKILPFEVLTSDISYIRTGEGFEYLCQVRDIASGVILGTSMSERMTQDLVERAIKAAYKRWDIPSGCIFHSDRGSQYTSDAVKKLLLTLRFRQSFSAVGQPGDNSWSESFFATLKKEAVHWRRFETREEARREVFGYIEGFYNTKRVQKRLGYLSPLKWLELYYQNYQLCVA